MLVKNVHIHNREGLWQILIEEGKISRIFPQDEALNYSGEILDGEEGIIYPPFVEPHIHLDATQTAGQPNWNQSGTLFEGIERWAERKSLLSHEDVKSRAWKTLKWQIANGIQYVRTHVDVSDPTLTALKAMLEVKKEIAPWVDLQIVAFPQEGILSYPNGEKLLDQAMEMGADVVGGILISNLPVNMVWSRCISLLILLASTTSRLIFIVMKLMMNSLVLWKRSRH